MDGIAAKLECLSDVIQLHIRELAHGSFASKHDVGSVRISLGRYSFSSILDVSGEKSDFSSHADRVRTKGLIFCEMIELKRSIKAKSQPIDRSDCSFFCLMAVKVCGCDDD